MLNISIGDRLELDNGLKATVTKKFNKTFFAKADGGKYREREYDYSGETIDKAFKVKSLLIEELENIISYDFEDGKGSVPAHRHTNPDMTKGGIVADSAQLMGDVRIGLGSMVFGNASVVDSDIKNNSRIGGEATVVDSVVSGSEVLGSTELSFAVLTGNSLAA